MDKSDNQGSTSPGVMRRMGADFASGARIAAPVLKRAGLSVGDWLARIGWGKFFLLSILVMIAGGMLNSLLFSHSPKVIVERGTAPKDQVNVVVSVGPEGVRVSPPGLPAPLAPVPLPALPPESGGATPPPVPPVPPVPRAAPRSGVQLDDHGVRIFSKKDGKNATVVIDQQGIHIEEGIHALPEIDSSGKAIVIPPDLSNDPEKAAEAVEAVRDKVEEIVNDQIANQVARQTRVYKEKSSDWFVLSLFFLITAGVIVKVVLGSKQKAETRAQQASATAAEEGLKRQLAEAQLKMMQAQVEPHFLFNTMASIDHLIETDPPRASRVQKTLIQYLRAALPQMREGSTTLGKEVSLCRAYLEILKMRMDDRLQFTVTVPQGLASAQFPPMMLQSLVENAIKHGLEPKPEGGSVSISADVVHGALRVSVADTGLGFGASGRAGTGVGLANVRERLAALYGGRATMTVESNTAGGTIALIEVPYTIDTHGQNPGADPTVAAQPA